MNDSRKEMLDAEQLGKAIQLACDRRVGVLDGGFMCQSVSVLNPHEPLCVSEDTSLKQVLDLLSSKRVGCVLIVNQSGKLVGIFSERDVVLKVDLTDSGSLEKPIGDLMTKDPISGKFEMTMAYALNLMSQGGFRHIPIVDEDNKPVGMISVKDVVDHIVSTFVDDVLSFETSDV